MPSVLAILATGFEEIEALAPVDLLRRAEIAVTLASLTPQLVVTGRCGIKVQADCSLDTCLEETFDCLLLPGGPGVQHLRADPRVRTLIHRHFDKGRCLAAICAAPTLLADAGLLKERRHTAHFSVLKELPRAQLEEPIVVEGQLITSRGAGTSLAFGLAIVQQLLGEAKKADIAKSICM